MNSLRQEIKEIIESGISCDGGDYPYYIGDPIDEILKIFEKRIDEYIADSDNFCHDCAIRNLDDIKEMLKS